VSGPDADPAAAAHARGMAAQHAAFERALAGGMPRAGWKVGLNVHEMQARLGLAGAAVAWLDGARVLRSGEAFAATAGSAIHVEAETALRLGAAVGAGAGPAAARAAITERMPALELVDYARPRGDLETILAHSIFHSATVLGAVTAAVEPAVGTTLPRVAVDGAVRAVAKPEWAPPDFGELLVHVARRLATVGEGLRAGDVVICGSYVEPLAVAAGQTVTADFGAMGRVSVTITA
jgi:2-oxo-hept-3-ene-1,7-dioate hydratase